MRPWLAVAFLSGMIAPALQGQSAPTVTEAWRVAGRARGTPAVDAKVAYFLSRNHAVVALERASGELLWEARTGERGDYTMGSRVVLTDDTVIAGDYNVIGFERSSGALRWRFQPSDGHAPGVYIGALHNGVVLTGSPAGRMYAVEGNSGALRWSAEVAIDVVSTVFEPITDGHVAFAAYTRFTPPATGGVVAVDASSGKVLWRASFPTSSDPFMRPTPSAGGPVLVDDLVIAPSGDGAIHAFDRKNGVIHWSIPSLEGPFSGIIRSAERDYRSLAIANGILVAGSVTGYIVGYDLASRKEIWRHPGGDDGSTSFQFGNDSRTVYAPYLSGMIVALDITTGRELWRVGDFRVGFLWPPAVDGNAIFAAASHGFYSFTRQ